MSIPTTGIADASEVITVAPQKDICPPRKNIANERRQDHQQKDDHTHDPHKLTRTHVRSVVQTTEQVQVNYDEEHGRPIGMHVS